MTLGSGDIHIHADDMLAIVVRLLVSRRLIVGGDRCHWPLFSLLIPKSLLRALSLSLSLSLSLLIRVSGKVNGRNERMRGRRLKQWKWRDSVPSVASRSAAKVGETWESFVGEVKPGERRRRRQRRVNQIYISQEERKRRALARW